MSISPLEAAGPGSVVAAKPATPATSGAPTDVPHAGTGTAPAHGPEFPSPTTIIDPSLNAVILEYRDANTGVEVSQIPTREQIRLYELSQQQQQAAVQPTAAAATAGPSIPSLNGG